MSERETPDRSTNYCFTSDLFEIEAGEDEQTNPYRYGKQLAHWLAEKLSVNGYPDAEALPEDWGWCVTCFREPFALWIGCGNTESEETLENPGLRDTQPIIWQCFVVVEVPFWKRMFGRPETRAHELELHEKLCSLLFSEPRNHKTACP
ncbi:MAG: hypothetical protein AAFX56_00640 [Pseudomonadota bacterium]